ncbi:NTP transferase domain-containing protein [Novosphingobium sp.]|uniref:nucleotidyltransferase family protein n=1 Tax=Novosphingobium sp. TaxID=1874826 RepID=UPI0025D666B6|nr:NTP transferase domain-containing protein [Novosphingobium sp.]
MAHQADILTGGTFDGVALVLLAAGRAERFGADKLAQDLAGKPVAWHAAQRLAALPFSTLIAVCSAATPVLTRFGYALVPLEPEGAPMSRSIALGVAAAEQAGARAVLLALADMPLVPAAHFRALVQAFEDTPITTLAGPARMPPAMFGRTSFAALRQLTGDRGARAMIAQADTLPLDPLFALDVDTPADLVRAERIIGEQLAPI